MRRIHLLRVEGEPEVYAPLLAAAAAAGLRVGWLELATAAPPPESLRSVLAAGGDRAVAVGEGWTLAVRPRKGAARLRELLRQQFLGCTLVLVRGELETPAPLVAASDDGWWRVVIPGGTARRFGLDELVAALRQPRPFAPIEPVT
jgi:hypothetical protein